MERQPPPAIPRLSCVVVCSQAGNDGDIRVDECIQRHTLFVECTRRLYLMQSARVISPHPDSPRNQNRQNNLTFFCHLPTGTGISICLLLSLNSIPAPTSSRAAPICQTRQVSTIQAPHMRSSAFCAPCAPSLPPSRHYHSRCAD